MRAAARAREARAGEGVRSRRARSSARRHPSRPRCGRDPSAAAPLRGLRGRARRRHRVRGDAFGLDQPHEHLEALPQAHWCTSSKLMARDIRALSGRVKTSRSNEACTPNGGKMAFIIRRIAGVLETRSPRPDRRASFRWSKAASSSRAICRRPNDAPVRRSSWRVSSSAVLRRSSSSARCASVTRNASFARRIGRNTAVEATGFSVAATNRTRTD